MDNPNKSDWFVQYLDEKFAQLRTLIENNKEEHDLSKAQLIKSITEVDSKHEVKHKNTRLFFAASIASLAFLLVKESRDFIIYIVKLFF